MRKDAGNLIFLVINLINTYDEFFMDVFWPFYYSGAVFVLMM
ncbi:hypothetical protein AC07_0951 [Escherichia coli 3-475-03_S3_C1]|nr:hypothetical protein AC07_0951 [Escherichia coli 3-475-03_S3_C1]